MNHWDVGGVSMRYPIMIGGGVCKTAESLIPYLHPDLPIGPPEVGSILPDETAGNLDAPQEYWIPELHSGLNAWGMPSPGRLKIMAQLDSLELADESIIANVAAFSPEGFAESFAAYVNKPYVAAVTGNLSCPNKHAERKIPISLDLESLELVLKALMREKYWQKPFWMKIAPVLYPEDLVELREQGFIVDSVPTVTEDYMDRLAGLIDSYCDVIYAVIATNTGPNFSYHVGGKPVTRPNAGLAGLSGKLLRPYSRRTAKDLLDRLGPLVDIIAAGGIWTGDDVADSLEDGCAAVQVTSLPHFSNDGPRAVASLLESERLQQILLNH